MSMPKQGRKAMWQYSDGAYDLPASGRELDARVARDVMGIAWDESRCRICGWPLVSEGRPMGCTPGNCSMRPRPAKRADEPPHYSTSIADAWTVVERMRTENFPARYRNLSLVSYCYNRTYATFDAEAFNDYTPETWAEANGEHATPLAICLASLKALQSLCRPAPQTE